VSFIIILLFMLTVYREEVTMTTTIGKTEFTARPGFQIVRAADPHISPMWAWGEVRYLIRRRLKYQIFVGQATSVTNEVFPFYCSTEVL
jgi:hypothetical protein